MQKIDLIKIYQRRSALVIDDFPDMRGSIRRMLVNFGVASADMASSGEEAIAKCENQHFDIILADYNLGEGKNGQQVLEELRYRQLLKHTSIYVMITAETTKAMVFGALEYQPDDYLTKPFTQTVLQKRLDRLMLEKDALRDINRALDQQQYDDAIALCDEHIEAADRYAQKCFRLKANCHYWQRNYPAARTLFEQALVERPLEWAQIGLGKTLMALGELDQAERIFQQLVDASCLCLEVYDYLAEIKSRRGDVATAQQLLEHASDISPNAIRRQQLLAEISQDNGDWERAEKAHRKVIRLGANSCYESPENYFKLARCIATQQQQSSHHDRKRAREAEEVLERARRRYRDDEQVKLQADVLSAGAHAGAGQPDEARRLIEATETKLADVDGPAAISITLDLARAYQALGEAEHARQLLSELAERHGDDEAVWEAIDRVADEPLSQKGKERAVELNAEGRELFARQDYASAISLFGEALRLYPNNVALKLNLLLALVKDMAARGVEAAQVQRCEAIVNSVRQLPPDHALYDRLQVLSAHVGKFRKAIA